MEIEKKEMIIAAAAEALKKMNKYSLKDHRDSAGKFYNHFRQEAYFRSKGELSHLFPKLRRLSSLTSDDHKFIKRVIVQSLAILFQEESEGEPLPQSNQSSTPSPSDPWDYYGAWD